MKKLKFLIMMILTAAFFVTTLPVNTVQADVSNAKYIFDTSYKFYDIKDEELSRVAEFLATLKIFNGYGDYTFRAHENIKRGEAAAVTVRMFQLKTDAVGDISQKFSDVDNTNMFYTAIANAVTLGLMNGFDDGTFRPDEYITFKQYITVLSNALGYSALNQYQHTDPYVTAKNAGILKDMTYEPEKVLTRGEVAQLLFNALHAPLFSQTSFGYDTEFYNKTDKTPLTEFFNIYKSFGRVNATDKISVTEAKPQKNSVVIGDVRYKCETDAFYKYLGMEVSYYHRENSDGINEIVFAYARSDSSRLELSGADIKNFKNGIYTYYTDGEKTKQAVLSNSKKLIVNGTYIKNPGDGDFDISAGSVTLVDSESDGNYDIVMIEIYENFILKNVSGSADRLTFMPEYKYEETEINFDEEMNFEVQNEEFLPIDYSGYISYSTDENGNLVASTNFSMFPQGCVISVFADRYSNSKRNGHRFVAPDAKNVRFVISANKVSGVLQAISDDGYIIDGDEYKKAVSNYMDESECICRIGDSGTFLLDYQGNVVSFIADKTSNQFAYGYLINAKAVDGIEPRLDAVLLSYDGKIEKYSSAKTIDINGKKLTPAKARENLGKSAALINPEFKISQMIKYKIGEKGNITHIQTVLQETGLPYGADSDHLFRDALPAKYDMEDNTRGRLRKNATTSLGSYFQPKKYFVVPPYEYGMPENYGNLEDRYDVLYSVYEPVYFYGKTLEMYDSYYKTPEIALLYEDRSGEMPVNTCRIFPYPVMVQKVEPYADADGYPSAKLHVAAGFWEKTYFAANPTTFDGLKPGDLIVLYSKGHDIISSWQYVLFDGIPITASNVAAGKFDVGTWKVSERSHQYGADCFGEVFAVADDGNIVLQAGSVKNPETGERETQYVGHINKDIYWMQGGAMVYDAPTDDKKEKVRLATIDDIKSVYAHGKNEASLVFWYSMLGAGRQYIIYNGLR